MKVQKQEILKRLEQVYQGAVPALHFANPFELLVATILSAQCTDARVNQVTKYLFLKYKNARELAAADFEELCEDIHSCGCYRVKAKNLMGMAKILEEKYGGEVPADMDQADRVTRRGEKDCQCCALQRLWHSRICSGYACIPGEQPAGAGSGGGCAQNRRADVRPDSGGKMGAGTPLAYLSRQADMPCAQARLFRLFFKRSLPECSSALLQIERGGEKTEAARVSGGKKKNAKPAK